MVKHIVFFKLKDNTPESAETLRKRLLSLQEAIPFIREIEVGINFKESDRAYDVALITVFDNEEDLARYATDPYHLEVIKYIKTVTSDTKVVDFKY
jgi:hypothetical protein